MGTFRLYTGADGQSHVEPIDPTGNPEWTKGMAVTQISFRVWPRGEFLDWHPAPRRQFVIILSGQLEIGLGDGSTHVFGPGDARLVEDTTGKGHTTRVPGPQPCVTATIPLGPPVTREGRAKEPAMAGKILFGPRQPEVILDLARSLTPPGFELVVVDPGTPEFYQAAVDAEYYLGLGRQTGGEFFRSAPKLRLVQLLSAGYDRVDIEAARKAGVPVANNGGANAIAVAEHALMLMLAVLKKLVRFHNDVVAGKWRVGDIGEARIYELAGKTLGIVGLGNIGKKVARRAAAFDMDVQYYDIARLTEDQEDALGVRFVLLAELLRTSDVVSLHVPLDDSTRNMLSTREFAMMRPSAILINTCRGPVVDEAALHRALTEGRIAGAGLDVMVGEPPPTNHPLFALPNVTFTPHSAGPTWENWTARFRNGFDNIQRVAAGRPPRWVIPELARGDGTA